MPRRVQTQRDHTYLVGHASQIIPVLHQGLAGFNGTFAGGVVNVSGTQVFLPGKSTPRDLPRPRAWEKLRRARFEVPGYQVVAHQYGTKEGATIASGRAWICHLAPKRGPVISFVWLETSPCPELPIAFIESSEPRHLEVGTHPTRGFALTEPIVDPSFRSSRGAEPIPGRLEVTFEAMQQQAMSSFEFSFDMHLRQLDPDPNDCLELYSVVLTHLPNTPQFAPLRRKLRHLFENHVQDVEQLLAILQSAQDEYRGDAQPLAFMQGAIRTQMQSCRPKTFAERHENRCERTFESMLAASIIGAPPESVRAVVHEVSRAVLRMLPQDADLSELYAAIGGQDEGFPLPYAFGAFPCPNRQVLEEALFSTSFVHVMYLHFIVARTRIRTDPPQPVRPRVESLSARAAHALYSSPDGPKRVIDGYVGESKLFANRGRKDVNDACLSNTLGLSRHPADMGVLGGWAGIPWTPDVESTTPDPDAPFVRQLLAKQLCYVSGPSNMTGIFMTLASLAAGLSRKEQQLYGQMVAAYLVLGGLHSFAEAFATLEDRFKLLSDGAKRYQVQGDAAGNFGVVFELWGDDFRPHLDRVWSAYLDWFASVRLAPIAQAPMGMQ